MIILYKDKSQTIKDLLLTDAKRLKGIILNILSYIFPIIFLKNS